MNLSGQYILEANREKVWEALNDPDVLKQSIPGCQSLEKKSDTEFEAKVTTKIGPMKMTFTGSVTLSNLNPPKSYKISGQGKGGAAGFAKGSADVSLDEVAEGTQLNYDVKANVGGKLAQLGARLIQSTSKKLADDFFSKFKETLADEQDLEPVTQESKSHKAEDNSFSLSAKIWMPALILIVLLITVLTTYA